MIAIEMDGNYIDGEPMKMYEAASLVKALNWHVLDNEVPQEL